MRPLPRATPVLKTSAAGYSVDDAAIRPGYARPSVRSFVRRRFLHGNFERIPTLLTNVPIPSSLAGDAFLSLDELAAATSAQLPTLVTKTNGMYLFHGTPASGFLLSPLCIALVKHFFFPSLLFLSTPLSPLVFSSLSLLSAIFFVLFLSSCSFRRPTLLLSSLRSFSSRGAVLILSPRAESFLSRRPSRTRLVPFARMG